ncbi:MAG TPA: hypothetical protein VGH80_07395 [Xanthomonadaceae bacterium]|jgi:hypothetical protein
MTSRKKLEKLDVSRMIRIAVAMGLASTAACAFATPGADAVDAQAREAWKETITHTPSPAQGCFHAVYPDTSWVRQQCFRAPHRHMAPPPVRFDVTTGSFQVVGNHDDYMVKTPHTISQAIGTFPTVAKVRFERGVGDTDFGSGGDSGPNEYSLQLNSGFNLPTPSCHGHAGCTIWEQFLYASDDFGGAGTGAVFIEYWLIGWGASDCPSGWGSFDYAGGSCVIDSDHMPAPREPITQIANMKLSGTAVPGGNDTVVFTDGSTAWSLSASDSVLDLGTAWNEAEFNVVGDADGSRADFNPGASLTLKIAVTDRSTSAPKCLGGIGTTGETNNLTLGSSCSTAGGATPYIQFTESNAVKF